MLQLAQFWPFVHPTLAAAGLAAGSIPIIIHLINRRKYRRVPWAAMLFLQRAKRQAARTVWMEHWLLLLLRIALIMLLGFAVARPYTSSSHLAGITGSHGHRIIVLDNSLSMQAVDDQGVTRFDAAKAYVGRLMESFSENDTVSLITTAYPAAWVIEYPERDSRVMSERLKAVHATQLHADFGGVVSTIEDMLESVDLPQGGCSVHVVSDFPSHRIVGSNKALQNSKAGPSTLTTLSLKRLALELAQSSHELSLVQVPSHHSENMAISDLSLSSPLVAAGFPLQVSTTVVNHGSVSKQGLSLTLRRDQQVVRTESLPPIGPGQHSVITMSLLFHQPGYYLLEASLDPTHRDALQIDNSKRLAVEVAARIPVLLVDGRRTSSWLTGQSGFIAASLAPEMMYDKDNITTRNRPEELESIFAPSIVDPSELESEALDAFPVIYLCNVSRLPQAQWTRLSAYVSRGGGLGIFAGDLVQIDNYNRYAFAEGDGLLPGTLQSVQSMHRQEDAWTIVSDTLPHVIVQELMSLPDSGLFLTRIERYLPLQTESHVDVVLKMNQGQPLMTASKFGQGRVLYMATSGDMAWNNLPAKGDFVSIIINSTAYLAGTQGAHRTLRVGDTLLEPLVAAESNLPTRVLDTNGITHEGQYVSHDEALAYSFGPVVHSGRLSISIGTSTRIFAVNVDAQESDIKPTSREALSQIMGSQVRVEEIKEGVPIARVQLASVEMAPYALLGVIVLMLFEILLSAWLGTRREPAPVVRQR